MGLVGGFILLVGGVYAWYLMYSKDWFKKCGLLGGFCMAIVYFYVLFGYGIFLVSYPVIATPMAFGLIVEIICGLIFGFYESEKSSTGYYSRSSEEEESYDFNLYH